MDGIGDNSNIVEIAELEKKVLVEEGFSVSENMTCLLQISELLRSELE